MLQSIDLDTLHHILRQYNEDVLNDCSSIICKLLNSLNETTLLQNLTSIKVLLNLCEKLWTNNNECKIKFSVNLLIENVKKVLQYSDDGCGLDNKIQLETLSIVDSLFKIPCIRNSSEAVEELTKLYHHCMTHMYAALSEKEYKQDSLTFKMKMVQIIYNLLKDSTCEINVVQFYESSRSNGSSECEVFTKLLLNGDNDVAIQTLMFLIPGYIDCFKTDKILEVIWREISSSVTNASINYSRAMLILCSFLDTYFDENDVEKEFFLTYLFEDTNYWQLLQSVLVDKDPVLRKQGMYVFKKTIEALNITNETIVCSKGSIIFYWDLKLKNKLYKIYSEIITILEFLDEQQIHIIKPIFKVAETLLGNVMQCDKMSQHWVLLVCNKALIHDSTEVMNWGLTNLLTFSRGFFLKGSQQCQGDIARKTVALLVPKLNNPALYYRDGLSVSKNLEHFFESIIHLPIAKTFFNLFIKQVCSLVWSPEALFFVMHAISHFSQMNSCLPCWGEDEIFEVRTFILKAFKTYNKIIAVGIQFQLLMAIMELTDLENVSLKSILLLISSFSFIAPALMNCKCWRNVFGWLRSYYPDEKAEELLDSFKRQELGKEFNEQSMAVMFILLYNFFNPDVSSCNNSNPVYNQLSEMLLSFKDIERRPYCQKSLYDQYLSVIGHIYKANANHSIEGMLRPLGTLIEDVMLYIRLQLKQISELQDLSTHQLYLNAFKNIIKVQKRLGIESEEIGSIYADVLGDLETSLHSDSECSSVQLYSRIQFLQTLLELHPCEVKLSFLASYLLTQVNEPLKKKDTHRELTKDMQTLWGRMNSEFIEAKWKIMEYLINNELIIRGPDQLEVENSISDNDLMELCVEGLNTGGYEVLHPVMSVLGTVLPAMNTFSRAREIIALVWKLIMERRKTDEFKSFGKSFVEMLFQKAFILKGESTQQILIEYADIIFSIPSLAMVNILMRHIQLIDLAGSSESVFCHIIGKALIFGPVQRRDEGLTNIVCSHIDRLRICPVWEIRFGKDDSEDLKKPLSQAEMHSTRGRPRPFVYPRCVRAPADYSFTERPSDHFTSNEVRGRAVERILMLDKDSERDQAIAKELIVTLMKVEGEIGGNRDRYFCDSHIHRVKHRVMQALLVLEPLLSENQDRRNLLAWLYDGLVMENPQPSVRYQKEWLLIRMLVKDRLEDTLITHLSSFRKIRSRGLCSLMVVQFHVYQLLPEARVSFDRIFHLVPLLVHPHYEVRLHAQVFISYHYDLARFRGPPGSLDRWGYLTAALEEVIQDEREDGHHYFRKLINDFFIHSFNPLEHYSLETIYLELPMLAKVGSDEWISTKLLQYCGVDPSKICIGLKNVHNSLKHDVLRYEVFSCTDAQRKGEELGQIIENYQKKIIPTKHWTAAWDERNASPPFIEKEEGLVVVASLIDRVPNLGGLARTCEIFGVSEYVINSLRHTEDKQFTSLSVTAEKWINLKEVKAKSLMTYIQYMKENGYTVVGAEQTLHSQTLSHVKFPKKTLLLLGNEKKGIPPNLLPLVDICVEIPQMGIIRSLNVHVTGALFIWEYAKQNNFCNFDPDE